MLEKQYHWKIPTDEDVIEKFGELPEEQPMDEKPDSEKPNAQPAEPPAESVKMESEAVEAAKLENIKADTQVKNEKILLISQINEEMKTQ